MADENENAHHGAEIHIGLGTDETGEGRVLTILHCPHCGNLEYQFALVHLPGIVAALTITLRDIAADIGVEVPDMTTKTITIKSETHGTLEDARTYSQDVYNKRKN